MAKNIKYPHHFFSLIGQFVRLLRVSQWGKSAFVFLGALYSAHYDYLGRAVSAALAFCLIASAVYIYNDIQDIERDQLHPYKCQRPLAARMISLKAAAGWFAALLISGLGIGWYISASLMMILVAYLCINLFYNHFFKYIPILDVLSIASGFMLRVLAGTLGIGLHPSGWLVLSATLLSLLIILYKRRLEKNLSLKQECRIVLTKYSLSTLDLLIGFTALSAFITYFLYTLVVHQLSSYFFSTLPFAALGIGRFIWIGRQNVVIDDPLIIFLKDKFSCCILLAFLILTILAVK